MLFQLPIAECIQLLSHVQHNPFEAVYSDSGTCRQRINRVRHQAWQLCTRHLLRSSSTRVDHQAVFHNRCLKSHHVIVGIASFNRGVACIQACCRHCGVDRRFRHLQLNRRCILPIKSHSQTGRCSATNHCHRQHAISCSTGRRVGGSHLCAQHLVHRSTLLGCE